MSVRVQFAVELYIQRYNNNNIVDIIFWDSNSTAAEAYRPISKNYSAPPSRTI